MANVSIAVKDSENSFNPYDMGGNISYLFLDEKVSWLKISPSFNSNWGDYKRIYDAQKNNLYGINFTGIKTLGSDGTFIGSVNYTYDSRIDVNRSVKYNTYGGEAFFINDSTRGDSRFTGPSVDFGYSFELVPDLYLGASAGYKILNGLKKIYSQTSTVLRNIDGSLGLTYRLTEKFFIAADASLFNSQELLTASLANPIDVEINNYHGDDYALTKRGSNIPEKIKSQGYSISSQLYYVDNNKEAGLNFVFGNSTRKFLFSTSVSNISVTEYEDGYSSFYDYAIEFNGRYDVNSAISFGLTGSYGYNSSWSKLSDKELTIWDWNIKSLNAGAGASYKFSEKVIAGVQYNFENLKIDSAKYIDYRFVYTSGNSNIIRAGLEFEAMNNIFVRAGAGIGKNQKDLLFGGSNIDYSMFSFGTGINVFENMKIDFCLSHNNFKCKERSLSRKFFDGLFTVKLFNI